MSDDLTQQLADEVAGLMLSNGYYSVQLDSVAALAVARAVLASGLVVPTRSVSDLAQKYADEPDWEYPGDHIAEILLALASQETL